MTTAEKELLKLIRQFYPDFEVGITETLRRCTDANTGKPVIHVYSTSIRNERYLHLTEDIDDVMIALIKAGDAMSLKAANEIKRLRVENRKYRDTITEISWQREAEGGRYQGI